MIFDIWVLKAVFTFCYTCPTFTSECGGQMYLRDQFPMCSPGPLVSSSPQIYCLQFTDLTHANSTGCHFKMRISEMFSIRGSQTPSNIHHKEQLKKTTKYSFKVAIEKNILKKISTTSPRNYVSTLYAKGGFQINQKLHSMVLCLPHGIISLSSQPVN